MIVVGLTGSIGMGKSTTAAMFAEHGDAVFDADRAVHALYEGDAVNAVGAAFPEAVVGGRIDRATLGARVANDPAALARLEAIVHPLVRREEMRAVARARGEGRAIIVLDIPLLFETGREGDVDAVVVASAPDEVQRARVLAREGMSAVRLDALLAKQMPDAEKRRRADFVVDTGEGLAAARRQVADIRRTLLGSAARGDLGQADTG